MVAPACSDAEFIELFESKGAAATAEILGVGVRRIYERRANLEKSLGRNILVPVELRQPDKIIHHPHRLTIDIDDGVIVVGSDAHYWPEIVTTAHRAFVKFCREFRPKVIVMNGDVLDGSTISRHPRIGWDKRPSLIGEIEACKERLREIISASGKARRIWSLGNHDARFETRLANVAPEYARVHGVSLHDHFPSWEPCWAVWANDDTVIKHRYKGGIHATHNNTLWSGKTIVTGHLHSLKVTPLSDYNGTRWGVDTGTLADAYGEQFTDYTEDNPRNWRGGFAVLTYHKGRLLWPEVVHVCGPNEVEFRGKVHSV